MYSVSDYGSMAADPVRIDAYARAIEALVRPGSVVLDLGAGTGIMTLLAVRAGASRVHAVEPNPAAWLLPELAAANGMADKVVLHAESVLEIAEVPERVDVCISDLRGATPLLGDHIAAIADVRNRWLKPGGVLLPRVDRLWVAVVEAEAFAARLERSWRSFEALGFDAGAAKHSILNSDYSDKLATVQASEMLTDGAHWSTLDYRTMSATSVEGEVELVGRRRGTARGLSVWFETELTSDIGFDAAPGQTLAYARLYLPLLEPVVFAPGHRARVTLRAGVRGDRWAWDTRVTDADGTLVSSLKQSTFLGAPTSPEILLRSSAAHRPTLAPRGTRARDALVAMDGTRTIEEIARGLTAPSRSEEHARDEVRRLARSYAR
jgi:protein arginine N-methyltransferase 1